MLTKIQLKTVSCACALSMFLGACGGDDSQPDASLGGNAMTGAGGAAGSDAVAGGGKDGAVGGAGGSASPGDGSSGDGTIDRASLDDRAVPDDRAAPDASMPEDRAVADGGTTTQDVLADAPIDARNGPLTIVTGAGRPTGIALSAAAVYWADEDRGTISMCPKTGCGANPPILVTSTPAPRGIALRGTTLYWISGGQADAGIGLSVWKCTLGACGANQAVDLGLGSNGGPFGSIGLAADDQRFYSVGGPAIVTCPVAGCGDGGRGQLGAVFMGPIFGVAIDDTTAYTGRAFGGVSTCPLSGCSTLEDETKIVNSPATMAIALDSTNVYWSELSFLSFNPLLDGAIRTCPKSGCDVSTAKVLAAGMINPYAMAVDDTDLFYTDYRSGRVERIPKDDFAHSCVPDHFGPCEACAGQVKCDGSCSAQCDASAD